MPGGLGHDHWQHVFKYLCGPAHGYHGYRFVLKCVCRAFRLWAPGLPGSIAPGNIAPGQRYRPLTRGPIAVEASCRAAYIAGEGQASLLEWYVTTRLAKGLGALVLPQVVDLAAAGDHPAIITKALDWIDWDTSNTFVDSLHPRAKDAFIRSALNGQSECVIALIPWVLKMHGSRPAATLTGIFASNLDSLSDTAVRTIVTSIPEGSRGNFVTPFEQCARRELLGPCRMLEKHLMALDNKDFPAPGSLLGLLLRRGETESASPKRLEIDRIAHLLHRKAWERSLKLDRESSEEK